MPVSITVGIIARNEEKFIGETLNSLINQTLESSLFEIIVVDGNSHDKTREIADCVLKNSNIAYKILNENDFGFYGHCFARNLVLDHSCESSKYIAFTDADCIIDKNWLQSLYEVIKETGNKIAGAGGPRMVAPTENKRELVINNFLISVIASGGNPAFSKRKISFLDSIPNYNSIYKKDIIKKFRYDDSLIISDDNEINYRIRKAGYNFIYSPNAKIYHRETDSIVQFARNMKNYGINITNTMRKHRLLKIKPLISIIFLIYLIFIIPLYLTTGWISLIPILLYLIFAVIIFAEVLFKTKTMLSILVFLLLPVQHICYAYGVIYNLLFVRPVHKNNK